MVTCRRRYSLHAPQLGRLKNQVFVFFPRKLLFRSVVKSFIISLSSERYSKRFHISVFLRKSLSDAFIKLNVNRFRITHLMIGRPFCYFVSMFFYILYPIFAVTSDQRLQSCHKLATLEGWHTNFVTTLQHTSNNRHVTFPDTSDRLQCDGA